MDFVRYIEATAHHTAATSSSVIGVHTHASLSNNDDNDQQHQRRILIPDSAQTSELQVELRRKVRSRYSAKQSGRGRNAQMYLMMDTGRDGRVTMTEFQAWTASVGLELSKEQCERVLGKHWRGDDDNEGIDLREFVRFLDELDDATVWWSHRYDDCDDFSDVHDGHEAVADDEAKAHMIDALHLCIDEGNPKENSRLVQQFRDFSIGESGADELSDASASKIIASLLSNSLGMSHHCAKSITGEWNGKLSKAEFVRLVINGLDQNEHELTPSKDKGSSTATAASHAENVLSSNSQTGLKDGEIAAILKFREALDVRQLLARKAFEKMDTNLTRDIDVDKLRSGFRGYGIDIGSPQAKRIIDRFDSSGNEKLNYANFIRLLTVNDL